MRNAGRQSPGARDAAEGFSYAVKRRLLGPPLVNEQLSEERLSKPLALGVLSCDGISSAAYGSDEILIQLTRVLPHAAAFTLPIPLTGAGRLGCLLPVLRYPAVSSVHPRA